MQRYKQSVSLEGSGLSLSGLMAIVNAAKGVGSVSVSDDLTKLTFEVEADDLWELRDLLDEIDTVARSEGLFIDINKEHVNGNA